MSLFVFCRPRKKSTKIINLFILYEKDAWIQLTTQDHIYIFIVLATQNTLVVKPRRYKFYRLLTRETTKKKYIAKHIKCNTKI